MQNPLHGFRIFGHVGRWLAFFGRFFPVAGPYWNSEDKWRIRAMTVVLIVLTIFQIVIATSINLWIENLFDSLENRDMRRFLILVGAAAAIMAANIVVTIFHLSVKRWLQIGWREWLTHRLLNEWMTPGLHYRVTLFPGEHTNPDGRIAEDIRFTAEIAIELAHSLLYAILILISFTTILWGLSGTPRLDVAGYSIAVPGHLVWIAVLYALIGTFVALRLGLPLVKAQNLRQTTEADFRFGLAHARQNSLLVALLRGEKNEAHGLRNFFHGAMRSWNLQSRALINLFYFSSAWWVLSQVFPILIAAPRYLAGAITLGVLMQASQAFQQVVGAMSWPVDNVSRLAEWRASVERVLSLHDSLGAVKRGELPATGETIQVETGLEPKLVFDDLTLAEPDGAPAMAPFSAEILPGQHVLIVADSTLALKLVKAMARLWPWGRGRLALPRSGPLFFTAQHPYLPPGPLRAVVAYPESPEGFSDTAVAEALRRVGLEHLIGDLDRHAQWGEVLPEDEQRRLGFARILLFRPNWVVFQDTFDSLAPETGAEMLRLLEKECPRSALIVVGQAAGLDGFAIHRVAPAPPGAGA